MIATSTAKIRELLYKHYEFTECIITDVIWKDQGATIELHVNYIWSDTNGLAFNEAFSVRPGTFREDLHKPVIAVIRLHLVQELHVHNWWSAAIESASVLDWGASEISSIRIQNDKLFLSKYRHLPMRFNHVTVSWEGDRRIDIVCSGVEVQSDNAN